MIKFKQLAITIFSALLTVCLTVNSDINISNSFNDRSQSSFNIQMVVNNGTINQYYLTEGKKIE